MRQNDWARLLADFNTNPPADSSSLHRFETESGIQLPDEYRRFLQHSNGGEGFIGKDTYIILWLIDELIELNKAYGVAENTPGLLVFGSDGGGEALAFDMPLGYKADRRGSLRWDGREHHRDNRSGLQNIPEGQLVDLKEPIPMVTPNGDHVSRRADARGLEIFEIHPVILGGSPTDPENKVLLSRQEHIKAVRYWNDTVKRIRRMQESGG